MNDQPGDRAVTIHARSSGTRPSALVADDCAEQRYVIRLALERMGFDVTEVRDGRELLAVLGLASAVPATYLLVVTDLHMPGYDGLRVLEATAETGFHPDQAIVTTGFSDAATVHRAARVGAAVLEKPFRSSDLLRLIRPPSH